MISNKQRSEVAANLRDEAEAWHNGDTVYEMSDYDFTESVLTAFGFDDMEMDAYRIFEKMADLIDRPTCKRVSMDATGRPPFYTGRLALNDVVGGCSECGYPFGNSNAMIGNLFNAPNYCPNCGAEVFAGAV